MSEFLKGFMQEPEAVTYNWMVVVYFFLGGLSAGAYLVSVASSHWLKDLKPASGNAAFVAPIALAMGMLILVFDLGNPMRFVLVGVYFNFSSPLTWGGILLGLFGLISVAHAYLLRKERLEQTGKLAILGVPCAIAVAVYTGILLNMAPGIVLWHNAMLPVLFVNGGIISGIAAAMLVLPGGENAEVRSRLGRIAVILVALELVMVFSEIAILHSGGTEAMHAARSLLSGQLSGIFWGAQIIAGSLVPCVLLVLGGKATKFQPLAATLLLVGVYAMRHIVVIGGQLI